MPSRGENVTGDHHPPVTKKIEPVNQESAKENVSRDYHRNVTHAGELVSHMKLAPEAFEAADHCAPAEALYTRRHRDAQIDDAAVDAVVQALKKEGFHKVTPDSIRSDLAEGAKIGNDPGNRSDRLLVKGVTGSLDADQAWMNYFRYDAAKSTNTQNLQTLPQSVISATDARQENR